MERWTSGSSYLRPMKRLMEKMVLSGLVTACRLATWPTIRSPDLGFVATTEGVIRLPSAFSSTVGSPASITATTEFVVPRSIPITLGMEGLLDELSVVRCQDSVRRQGGTRSPSTDN